MDELFLEILPETDLGSLEEGDIVLCFQPGSQSRSPTEIFMKSKEKYTDSRSAGWWIGKVASFDRDGSEEWALVQAIDPEAETSQTLWDYDGKQYPIYKINNLPPSVHTLIDNFPPLTALLEEFQPANLEDEFFSRP